MSATEWVSEDSQDYQKILLFNDPKNPAMKTAPGEKIDCYVNEAYVYVTKKDQKIVIGLIPKIMMATNMTTHPLIAGEYMINNLTGRDTSKRPYQYLVDHRQMVNLDVLNHIIDLNRPDVLNPQSIYEDQMGFKDLANVWTKHNWISPQLNAKVQSLPANRSDLVDESVVSAVSNHAGFKRALSQWRQDNWIDEKTARQYAATGAPIKTIDDELSFKVSIEPNLPK